MARRTWLLLQQLLLGAALVVTVPRSGSATDVHTIHVPKEAEHKEVKLDACSAEQPIAVASATYGGNCCGTKHFPPCSEIPSEGNWPALAAACDGKPTCEFTICRCPVAGPITCGAQACSPDPYRACAKEFSAEYYCGGVPLFARTGTGWLLAAGLLSGAGVYLGLGALQVKQRTGRVGLPHATFWHELRGLVTDGWSFAIGRGSSAGAGAGERRGKADREAALLTHGDRVGGGDSSALTQKETRRQGKRRGKSKSKSKSKGKGKDEGEGEAAKRSRATSIERQSARGDTAAGSQLDQPQQQSASNVGATAATASERLEEQRDEGGGLHSSQARIKVLTL